MSRPFQAAAIIPLVAIAVASGCAESASKEPRGTGPSLLVAAPGSPVAVSAGAMAAGDVNGDRRDDLVLCVESELRVFFGSDQRAWQKDSDSTTVLPSKASEMALADLNGDAKLDVVLADHDSYAVSVMVGGGDGRFQPSAGSPFLAREGDHPHTHGLAIADIDQDGHLDIVTANHEDDDLSLLLGDGKGGFVAATGSPFPCGPRPYPIAAADINGDGNPDVLVPNASHNLEPKTLTILLGNAGGELKASPASPLTCDANLWYVAAGDLNGDQRPDVVATHMEGGTGATILLNLGDGKLSPAPGSPLEFGHGAWGVETADMNGDGKADLVVAADTSIQLFLGDGHGGFTPAGGSPYATGKGAWRLVVADFNGDGKPDVATRCVEAKHLEILFGN